MKWNASMLDNVAVNLRTFESDKIITAIVQKCFWRESTWLQSSVQQKWGFEWQTAPPAVIKLCCLYVPANNALHGSAGHPMAAQRRFSLTDGRVAVPKFEGDTPMTPGGSLREWPGRSADSGWGPAPQGHRGSGVSRRVRSVVHVQQQTEKISTDFKEPRFLTINWLFQTKKTDAAENLLLRWHCLNMKTCDCKTFCILHLCHILFMWYKREQQALWFLSFPFIFRPMKQPLELLKHNYGVIVL